MQSAPIISLPSAAAPKGRGVVAPPKRDATSTDIVCVILFLVMYYIRPQEWSSIFSAFHFVQIVMIMSISTLIFRERKLTIRDLFKTPHDWAIFLFLAYAVLTAPSLIRGAAFRSSYPLLMFYVVIVQTLLTVKRMKLFVGWWMSLIIVIAALAIASEYGFDPLGSHDVTEGRMKDRLVLNLSIFNNPNALGHSVVPSIAMIYFFLIWKRPMALRLTGWAMLGIPATCIFMTASKGSFLSGAVTLLATLTFGRPRWVQIAVISGAIVFGGAVLYKLPRMTELNKTKTDAAIQGRVIAFTHGLRVMKLEWLGCGHGNWMEDFYHEHHFYKAAHSSYVQTGAELGLPGFFLFFLLLYCNLRTLITAQTRNDEEERLRRTLFVLVISYMVSSWMVDFGFRPTLFMFTAAIAAFHRHLYSLNIPEAEEQDEAPALLPGQRPGPMQKLADAPLPPRLSPARPMTHPVPLLTQTPPWRGRFAPTAPANGAAGKPLPAMVLEPAPASPAVRGPWTPPWETAAEAAEPPNEPPPEHFWNRIGVVDLTLVLIMTKGAERFWGYLITRM